MLDHLQSYVYCNYKGLRCNLHCNFEDYIVISRGHARFRIKYKDPWPLLSSFSVKTHLRLQSSLSFVINNEQICPSFKTHL